MVLFELLQLFLIFLDYLRIKYLWHVLIMPLTNQNGIRTALRTARRDLENRLTRSNSEEDGSAGLFL
jgi:hypothetical protein